MKKFVTRVILFLLLIAVCDYAVGVIGEYAFNHSRGGFNLKSKEIRDTAEPDIVIFGSSRAEHHYVPDIIADSLNASAYNMGVDGSGILLMYPYLSQLVTRHTPSIVIYDVLPSYDFYDDNADQYLKNISLLRGLPAADSIMSAIDPTLSLKLLSHSYPYNSQYPSLLQGVSGADNSYSHGYTPLWGQLPERCEPTILGEKPYSQLKQQTFDNLISLCNKKGIRLIIAISPFYGKFSDADIRNLADLCDRNGLEFLDFSQHPDFANHPEMFTDTYHLNSTGAELFTRMLGDSIKSAESHK